MSVDRDRFTSLELQKFLVILLDRMSNRELSTRGLTGMIVKRSVSTIGLGKVRLNTFLKLAKSPHPEPTVLEHLSRKINLKLEKIYDVTLPPETPDSSDLFICDMSTTKLRLRHRNHVHDGMMKTRVSVVVVWRSRLSSGHSSGIWVSSAALCR